MSDDSGKPAAKAPEGVPLARMNFDAKVEPFWAWLTTQRKELGFFLGLEPSLSAMMFAFWSGALVGIVMILTERLLHRGQSSKAVFGREIPFAPFLVLGIALVYFAHLYVIPVLTS